MSSYRRNIFLFLTRARIFIESLTKVGVYFHLFLKIFSPLHIHLPGTHFSIVRRSAGLGLLLTLAKTLLTYPPSSPSLVGTPDSTTNLATSRTNDMTSAPANGCVKKSCRIRELFLETFKNVNISKKKLSKVTREPIAVTATVQAG